MIVLMIISCFQGTLFLSTPLKISQGNSLSQAEMRLSEQGLLKVQPFPSENLLLQFFNQISLIVQNRDNKTLINKIKCIFNKFKESGFLFYIGILRLFKLDFQSFLLIMKGVWNKIEEIIIC